MRAAFASLTIALAACGAGGYQPLLASCAEGASAEWSPRDPTKEYPESRRAVRIHDTSDLSDCAERIGVVHASGEPDQVIGAISSEAAAHGGTHYIVKGDREDDELVTDTRAAATALGGIGIARSSSRTHVDRTRAAWATVYRDCK